MEFLAAINTDLVSQWITAGGYIVLFGLLFACGLGLPLPEEVPLLSAGVLIATGHMVWPIAAVCAWTGIVGGDCCLYAFGRKYGRNVQRLWFVGKHVTPSRLDTASQAFKRWGAWVILAGRMVAGVRLWMVIAAGTLRYHFKKFLVFNGFGAMISAGIIMWLGYLAGRQMGSLENIWLWIHSVQSWIFWGLIVGVGSAALFYLIRRTWGASDDDAGEEPASAET